jgi:hypothetical protein
MLMRAWERLLCGREGGGSEVYVKSRSIGMAGYRRRGLGLSCPGDPACPNYVDPNVQAALLAAGTCTCVNGTCVESGNSCAGSMTAAQSTAQQAAALALQNSVDPSTLTGFLNVNSTYLMLGAAAFLGLLFMRGGGR